MPLTHASLESIREALTFLVASTIPEPHKAVLVQIVTDELRSAEQSDRQGPRSRRGQPWQSEELHIVAERLVGKTAISWQHADEVLIALAARLQRTAAETKSKAVELGFAVSVDYSVARIAASSGQ